MQTRSPLAAMSDRSFLSPQQSESSFFSSPAQATPQPQMTPVRGVAANRQQAPSAMMTDLPVASAAAAFGGQAAAVPNRLGLQFDPSSATPMPGALSFTPALHNASQRQSGMGFFSTPSAIQQQQAAKARAQAGFSRPAAAVQLQFTSTPSMNVPLDFPTPHTHRPVGKQTSATAAAGAMQFPSFRPHSLGAPPANASAAPLPLSMFASGLPSATVGRPLGAAGKLHLSQLQGLGVPVTGPLPPPIRIDRAPLRALVSSCMARGQLGGAVFYADKLATLEEFSNASVLLLAQAYARDRQYQRAVHLLRKHKLLQLPRVSVTEWRAQQQQRRWNEEKKQDQPPQQQSSKQRKASDDADDASSDPLMLRLECLYLGLQSLLEMKAYEEAGSCCLPDESAAAMLRADADATSWDYRLNEALVSCASVAAPVLPARCTAQQRAEVFRAAAVPVRDIIGEQEVNLFLTLLKCHALQREKRTAAQPSSTTRGSNAQSHNAAAMGEDTAMTNAATASLESESDYEGPIDLCSSISFLRGELFEIQSHKYKSILWFKFALWCDVRNYEALERLTSKRLLSAKEEWELLQQPKESNGLVAVSAGAATPLHFPRQLEWLRLIWLNRVDVEQVGGPADAAASSSSTAVSALLSRYTTLSVSYSLGDNHDLLSSLVSHYYQHGDYRLSLQISAKIQSEDPWMLGVLPVYLAALVENRDQPKLFFVAHRLVESYPDRAISWFAVGCYYFLLGALDVARRFFYKSTRIDGLNAQSWVGFGHTFSLQDESEQALMSYRTANRLFPGSHLPLLCIGQEYLRTNHFILTRHFLSESLRCHPGEPLAHHELGVVAYKLGEFAEAVKCFNECLRNVQEKQWAQWEPTLFNLGHAYRKLKRYPEAISSYNRALSVCVRGKGSFSILSALGFTYHLQGQLHQSIQYYHKALGTHPGDTFTMDMLDRALKEVAEEEFEVEEAS